MALALGNVPPPFRHVVLHAPSGPSSFPADLTGSALVSHSHRSLPQVMHVSAPGDTSTHTENGWVEPR